MLVIGQLMIQIKPGSEPVSDIGGFADAGKVEVTPELAQELLQAADQYMLDGLKRLAEATIGAALSVAHLPHIHELADDYAAPQLGQACAMFALQNYQVCCLCSYWQSCARSPL